MLVLQELLKTLVNRQLPRQTRLICSSGVCLATEAFGSGTQLLLRSVSGAQDTRALSHALNFLPSHVALDYFTSGTSAGWVDISASVTKGNVPHVPTKLFAGSS